MRPDESSLAQHLGDAETSLTLHGHVTFESWWLLRSVWSMSQFGSRVQRGPLGPAEHLLKEANELYEAARDLRAAMSVDSSPEVIARLRLKMHMEAIDCIFLACDVLDRDRVGPLDALRMLGEKLVENRQRAWGPRSATGAVEHVRESHT